MVSEAFRLETLLISATLNTDLSGQGYQNSRPLEADAKLTVLLVSTTLARWR